MKKLVLVLGALVALSGCDTTSWSTNPTTSPAPLQKTVIDDRAVRYGFLSLDTLASLADSAMDAKLIVPGTEKAKAIANGLDRARNAMNAASAAQKVGSVSSYNAAFDEALEAMASVKLAIGK